MQLFLLSFKYEADKMDVKTKRHFLILWSIEQSFELQHLPHLPYNLGKR
ncbi:hypothetical protein SAMN04488524_3127 [Pedobacter africanus]|uniref:Uncharacterized protein n=1 Tax=Pedobacter africanus TaxID=151894 RepID=A0A1W2CRR6_9SPHI|nr:hypothetical protein SAMN04488524_3127 [Pedobacter africanus]